MKAPAASIRNLLVIVLVLAVDCGLVHDCLADQSYFPYEGWPLLFRLGFLGSLPVANLVIVGGSMLFPRRGGGRPFLAGFVVAGAFSILVMQCLALVAPWDWFIPLFKAINDQSGSIHQSLKLGMRYSDFFDASIVLVYGGLFFLPELLIAMMGGLAARSLVRPDPQPDPSPGVPIEPPESMARGLPGR